MTRWVALLRGINVGGHNKLPMAELRSLAESIGLAAPVTYIQSGNLLFDHDGDEAGTVQRLEAAIEDRFGFTVPIVLRSSRQIRSAAAAHPFAAAGLDAKYLMVAFLDREPQGPPIDPNGYLPDRLATSGREVYLAYPNGIGRSKLDHTALERGLGVRATIRNWNTVQKLAALAAE